MTSKRKRKDGTVVYTESASYFDETKGKRVKKQKSGFKTKKEAIEWKQNFLYERNNGFLLKDDDILLGDFLEKYYKLKKEPHSQPRTITLNKSLIKKIKNEFNFPLNKITHPMFQSYINKIQVKYSAEYIDKILDLVKSSVKYALREKYIRDDFTIDIQYTAGKKAKKESEKYLEVSDFNDLINSLNLEILSDLMIYLGIYTGARYAEIAGLKLSDLSNNSISINKSYDEKNKKITLTKTEGSNRNIELDSKYIKNIKKFSPALSEEDFIFKNENSEYPITSASVNKRLSKLLKDNNLKHITFHGLRHTHASYLISKNIDVAVISRRLGHASTTITLNKYSHLLSNKNKEENKKISSSLDEIGTYKAEKIDKKDPEWTYFNNEELYYYVQDLNSNFSPAGDPPYDYVDYEEMKSLRDTYIKKRIMN